MERFVTGPLHTEGLPGDWQAVYEKPEELLIAHSPHLPKESRIYIWHGHPPDNKGYWELFIDTTNNFIKNMYEAGKVIFEE